MTALIVEIFVNSRLDRDELRFMNYTPFRLFLFYEKIVVRTSGLHVQTRGTHHNLFTSIVVIN